MRRFGRGDEPVIRRMFARELPEGWKFDGAHILDSLVRARFSKGEAVAEVSLELLVPNTPRAKGITTEHLRVAFASSPTAPGREQLFTCVLGSIRTHEHELALEPDHAPALEAFRALVSRGRYAEALATVTSSSPELSLAAAEVRAALHDDERAAIDARAALKAPRIAQRVAATEILSRTGHRVEALALARSLAGETDSVVLIRALADVHRDAGDHDGAAALHQRAGAANDLARCAAWRGDATGARRTEHPLFRGIADALEGNHVAALVHFERATSLAPRDAESALWRAEMYLRLGQNERARDEAARARELASDGTNHVAGLLVRAAIMNALGITEPVDPVLAEAMTVLSPTAPTDWHAALSAMRGNRSELTTYVDVDNVLRNLATAPAPRVAAKHALWRLVATASVEEAEADFAKVRARYPDVPEINNYHGELYLYVGDHSRARSCFERALSMYSESRWAFIGLAAVEILEGRPDAALSTLARGPGGPPGPTAYVYRGEAHRRLGARTAARADLEHAVSLHPSRIGAWINLGLLQHDENDRDGLARTMSALRDRASAFVADATEASRDERAILEEMLAMLRGNRSSTCVTYFTRGGALRSVPPRPEAR